jgi:hypothetical protein
MFIIRLAAKPPCRRGPLSSNVRPHTSPPRTLYSAQTADWTFSFFAIWPVLVGAVFVLGAALRPKTKVPDPPGRLPVAALGVLFLGVGVLAAAETIALTNTCISKRSVASAQVVEGVVGPVEAVGKFSSQYYRFSIGSERFVSASRGAKSECGYKASMAQVVYPPVGRNVRVRAIGSTIVEMEVLK